MKIYCAFEGTPIENDKSSCNTLSQNGELYAKVTRIRANMRLCVRFAHHRSTAQFVMEPPQIACIFKRIKRNLIAKIQRRVARYIRVFNRAWRNYARVCANLTRAREAPRCVASMYIITTPGSFTQVHRMTLTSIFIKQKAFIKRKCNNFIKKQECE